MAWDVKHREKYEEYHSHILNMIDGRQLNEQKQHEAHKLTARERMACLFDNDSFVEIDTYKKSAATDFDLKGKAFPGDGVITGFGTINGQVVYAAFQDVSVMGGSLGRIHGEKICRIQDMAYENRCPIVFVIDSGGARVEEGVASLAGYSGIFLRNTKCSGVIPQFALLLGYSVGGSSYLPALCDFTFMTEKTSKMFITGPGVVKVVIGEEVTADELGGSLVHSKKSGATDFVFSDDKETITGFKKLFSYLYPDKIEDNKKENTKATAYDSLEDIVSDDQRKCYNVKDVIMNLVDKKDFLECKKDYAENIVTAFAKLNGSTIGIVANQPMVLGGSLDSKSAEKAARFIRFCDSFNIPLLTLVDTPGFWPGKKQEEEGIIRRGAKLLYAYSEATVPKVTLVLRKAYGGAYIAMNSKQMGADIVFAWPIAQLAVIGSEGAVNVVFRKEIANAIDPEKEREMRIKQYKETFMNPYYAAEQGFVDEILLPENTREKLIVTFEGLKNKYADTVADRKHGNIPL